jgi:hypothetical protein
MLSADPAMLLAVQSEGRFWDAAECRAPLPADDMPARVRCSWEATA